MWLCFLFNTLVVALFVLTLNRLLRSRAKAKVPGHLDKRVISSMFMLFLCLVITFFLSMYHEFNFSGYWKKATVSVFFSLMLVLETLYAYVLASQDLSSFEPRTQMTDDGKIALIGIGLNGNELFRFIIDSDRLKNQPNPVGF